MAISYIDRGTARRTRAMRALRLLWRIQATFRVHVSTRYIASKENTLADSAPRLDLDAFKDSATKWLETDASSLRSDKPGLGHKVKLLHVPLGHEGGATGLLAERLCSGHTESVSDAEEEMDGVLCTFSAIGPGSDPEKRDRLPDVPRDYRRSRGTGLFIDSSLSELFGNFDKLYKSGFAKSDPAHRYLQMFPRT